MTDDPGQLNGGGCHACGRAYEGAQTACDSPTCFEEWLLTNEILNRTFTGANPIGDPRGTIRGTRPI